MKKGEKQRKKLWARGLVQLVLLNLETKEPLFREEIKDKSTTAMQK